MSSLPAKTVDRHICIIRGVFASLGVIQAGLLMYDYTCVPYHGRSICFTQNDSTTVTILAGINLLLGVLVGINAYFLFSRTKKVPQLYVDGPSGLDWFSALFFILIAVLFGSSILNRKSKLNFLSKSFEGVSIIINIVAAAILLVLLGCWDAQIMDPASDKQSPTTTQSETLELKRIGMRNFSSSDSPMSDNVFTDDDPTTNIEGEVVVEQHARPSNRLAAGVTLQVDQLESGAGNAGNGQKPEASDGHRESVAPPDSRDSELQVDSNKLTSAATAKPVTDDVPIATIAGVLAEQHARSDNGQLAVSNAQSVGNNEMPEPSNKH